MVEAHWRGQWAVARCISAERARVGDFPFPCCAMKAMTSLLGVLALLYLLFGAALYWMQRQFMYFPTPDLVHEFETVQFDSGDATLKLVLLNSLNRKAVLYFGGNAEAVVHNAPAFEAAFPDHAVYLVNYRGYGGSSGEPSQDALFADALRLWDQLAPLYDSLAVIGRSLGSGVATHLAAERPVEQLALVTPFDSIAAVARAHYPIYPVSLMLKDPYDNVIPRRRTDRLIAAFDTPPRVITFEGTDHNSLSNDPLYNAAIADFLARRSP